MQVRLVRQGRLRVRVESAEGELVRDFDAHLRNVVDDEHLRRGYPASPRVHEQEFEFAALPPGEVELSIPVAGVVAFRRRIEIPVARLFDLVGDRWVDLCRLPEEVRGE